MSVPALACAKAVCVEWPAAGKPSMAEPVQLPRRATLTHYPGYCSTLPASPPLSRAYASPLSAARGSWVRDYYLKFCGVALSIEFMIPRGCVSST